MRKAKEIIGLPVLTFSDGSRIDTVKDVLFDPASNRVLAFLVDEGGWFDEARVIPFNRVHSIGPDAIIIEDRRDVIPASRDRSVTRALRENKVISNMRVYTEDGRDLGTIGDMFLDPQTGEVTGYEVSGGFLAETLRGKKFMPAPSTLSMGRDVTFVPSEVGTEMEQAVTGGVEKAFGEARRGAAAAGEQVQAAAGQVSRSVQRQTDQLLRASTDQQKRYVIGKRSSSTIRTPDGRTIIRKGDTVSQSDANEAERVGVLGQLVSAVVAAEAGAIGTQAQQTGGTFQSGAAQAWEDIRGTLSGTATEIQRTEQQQRINNALGRPVTRVILDRDDSVILNTGEIITHDAIRRADQAGVLDVLLSSVARGEPGFTVEERKAPEPGKSSLGHEERRRK